jgi:hypothetical protein
MNDASTGYTPMLNGKVEKVGSFVIGVTRQKSKCMPIALNKKPTVEPNGATRSTIFGWFTNTRATMSHGMKNANMKFCTIWATSADLLFQHTCRTFMTENSLSM